MRGEGEEEEREKGEMKRDEEGVQETGGEGYNLGMSSLMLAILKNQLRQVSLAESGTWSGVKFSIRAREHQSRAFRASSPELQPQLKCHPFPSPSHTHYNHLHTLPLHLEKTAAFLHLLGQLPSDGSFQTPGYLRGVEGGQCKAGQIRWSNSAGWGGRLQQ